MDISSDRNKIIRDYIDNEIAQVHNNLPADTQRHLSNLLINFFTKQQNATEEQSRNAITALCGSSLILEKVKKIRDVSATPLPRQFAPDSSTLRRKRSFPWSEAEDVRLIYAVNQFGPRDWKRIAEFVGGGRNSSQCNQRWCRALDPQIVRSGWTTEEDSTLLRAVEVLGRTAWCQVAKVLGGRTDLQCRYRFFQLSKIGKVENAEMISIKESGDDLDFDRHPNFGEHHHMIMNRTHLMGHSINNSNSANDINNNILVNSNDNVIVDNDSIGGHNNLLKNAKTNEILCNNIIKPTEKAERVLDNNSIENDIDNNADGIDNFRQEEDMIEEDMSIIVPKRRNSISIAPFTIPAGSIGGSFEMPPYYLESSLRPRQDQNQPYLHRVPPLLIMRKAFQTK